MLKQKFILSYGSKLFVQFITIAASIVVARVAGPTVMGTIAFALAYVSMLGFLTDFGLGTVHIKMVSEGRDLGKCISTYGTLKAGAIILFLLFFSGMFLIQKYILKNEFESKIHEYVILITLGMILVSQFSVFINASFAGNTEQAKQDIPYLFKSVLQQVLRIIIVLAGGKAIALAFGNLAAAIIIVPVLIYMFKGYSFSGFDKQLAKEYLKMATPIFILSAAITLTNTIDKVLLQNFTDSEQVGYYAAGFRVGGFILLISRSMNMLFFPLFSQAVTKGDFIYIKEKINKFERFSYLFILPFVILVILFSKDIVLILLGEQYIPSIEIMAIVTVALFINVLNSPYENLLRGLGEFKLIAGISLINLFIYIGVIIVFISDSILGMEALGIAWSLMISNVLLGIVYRYFAINKSKYLDNKTTVKFIIYGVINFLICAFVFEYIIIDSFFVRLLLVPVFLVVTFSSFHILGWMNKDDWKSALSLFDINEMKKYITGEIKSKKNEGN